MVWTVELFRGKDTRSLKSFLPIALNAKLVFGQLHYSKTKKKPKTTYLTENQRRKAELLTSILLEANTEANDSQELSDFTNYLVTQDP